MKRFFEMMGNCFEPTVKMWEQNNKPKFETLRDNKFLEEFKINDNYNGSPGSALMQDLSTNVHNLNKKIEIEEKKEFIKNTHLLANNIKREVVANIFTGGSEDNSAEFNDGFGGMDGVNNFKSNKK